MNSYSLNNYSSINGFNSYFLVFFFFFFGESSHFLVGVIISKINIFSNKQTSYMCIIIMKIKILKNN